MLNSPFMVRARALTGFANVVAECGADPARLLRESGLSVSLLDRPDAPIPVVAFAQLLARAAEELQVPDFSLRMAACQDLTVLGAVSLIGLNSATVGEAVLRVGRNLPYHSPALQIQLERSGEQDVLRLINDVKLDAAPMRQLAEHTLLNSTNILEVFPSFPVGTGPCISVTRRPFPWNVTRSFSAAKSFLTSPSKKFGSRQA